MITQIVNLNSKIITTEQIADLSAFLKNVNYLLVFTWQEEGFIKNTQMFLNAKQTIASNNLTIEINTLDKLEIFEGIDYIVGLGSGKVMDISKYLAYKHNFKLTLIPSILSTNAFATDKACLLEGHKKITLDCKQAETLIFCNEFLSRKNSSLQTSGVCDVLSIHTALKDWSLAIEKNKDILNPFTYQFSYQLLNSFLSSYKDLLSSKKFHSNIIWYLIMSGYITNIHGSGRPESGSEHIFSKVLESAVAVPHGVSVALGILIISKLQENEDKRILEAIKAFDLLKDMKKYNITSEIIVESLLNCQPRKGRYGIFDKVKIERETAVSIVTSILKEFQ